MKQEQLNRAKVLEEKIEKLKEEELELWNDCIGFSLSDRIESIGKKHGTVYVHTHKIPFDVVKTLVIDSYNKEISQLEAEFASL